MPIKWEELQNILPTDFTILNAFDAIKKSGENYWKDILEKKQESLTESYERHDNNK